MEAFTRDQIIRLTADFETCLDILKLVVHTLGNIRSSAVKFPAETSPDSLSSNPLKGKRKAVFRQIMESTNTVIKDNILPASDGQVSRIPIASKPGSNIQPVDSLLPWA